MKKLISIILTLFLMIILYGTFVHGAAAQASNDEIVISDSVLESKVREALCKPEGTITTEDAARLDWLDASADPNSPEYTRVRDLSALRHFVNLAGIRLDNNLVSDISVLTELPNIQELWLLENPLDNLDPLGSLTKLVKLGFSSSMRDISFIGYLTSLEELRIDGCRELPQELAGLKKLKVFCSLGGELSDISLLAQIPTLEVVDLSWNLVSDVTPLANLPLRELYLAGCPVEDYSPLKDLYPNLVGRSFEIFDLAEPRNPDEIVAFPDPVMEWKVREALGKPEGDITAGDAAQVTALRIQNEWQPQIPDDVIVKDIQGLQYFINLRELDAGFNDIGDISPLSGLSQLREINLGGNPVGDIDALAGLTNLERLTLFGGRFNNINPLAGLTSMRSLHLGNLPVYDLSPLAGLTNIDHLYTGGCGIEDISPLAGMTNMYRLELTDNYIKDLTPLAGMANLIMLKLANNPIQDYSPIQDIFPKLQEKDFELGQVFDVDVPLKPENPDAEVPIGDAGLEAILREATGVSDRALTQRDLCTVGKLVPGDQSLWENVSDLSPLRYCLNMEGIVIDRSQVSDLSPLSGLTKLRGIRIDNSMVSDLSPLAGRTSLTGVEFPRNQIEDISALATLPGLERAELIDNRIADFSPLYGLQNLKVLHIQRNGAQDVSGLKELAGRLKEKDFDPNQPLEMNGWFDGDPDMLQPKDPNKVIKFSDKVMERRVREAIGKPEGKITAGEAAMVEELNLGNEWQEKFPKGSQISDLGGIEHFINLKRLDISWNKIKDIKKLSGLTKLEYLKAFGNQITSIAPLKELVNLNNLNIGGNKLTKIDALKNLANLKSLYLDGNKIKDFSAIESIYPWLEDKDFTLGN